MKIALDAGHGLHTAGKRCSSSFDSNQTREWTLNSRVVEKEIALLNQYENVHILRIDDPSGQTDIGLTQRCNKANSLGADIYISNHHNAGGGEGVETFCHPSQGAGSSSHKLAVAVNNAVVSATGNRNRGAKTQDFAVCRQTNMPAILTELGFMDHVSDTPRILSEEYATKAAQGVVDGIVSLYGLQKKESIIPEPSDRDTYTVQPGDTLSKIAGAHGCTYEDLMAINPQISDPDIIHVGDSIHLTGSVAPPPAAPVAPTPPAATAVDVEYCVRTKKHGFLSAVKNDADYAGYQDSPITAIAIGVSAGSVKYRVHLLGGGWLPWVTGYDKNDHNNGYAGNGQIIDALEVIYYTPDHIRPFKKIKYKADPVGSTPFYSWQYDNEKTNGQDGFAGCFGKPIANVQMVIE